MRRSSVLLFALFLLISACTPPPPAPKILVSIVADNLNRSYELPEPITVGELLEQTEITLGELDDVNPMPFTQITNGMIVTIVRVEEENYCETQVIPYGRRTTIDETIPADGQEITITQGQNGEQEVCFRVEIRDNVRQQPVQTSDGVVVRPPVDELVAVPPPSSLDPVDVSGTIAYISKGNAWIIRGNTQIGNRRPVTEEGDLDGRVFSLSNDGRQLLFSRRTDPDVSKFANQLWMIPDVGAENPQAVQLRPENVLYADWFPNEPNTITYSRAEPRDTPPGWVARNDLLKSLIDPVTGEEINLETIVEEYNGGSSGWWGTKYIWSHDGEQLAWVEADGYGIIDLETQERIRRASYPYFFVPGDWSWRSNVAWSPDNEVLVGVIHGPPPSTAFGSDPTRSPVFNVAFTSADGDFSADMVNQAGIWANPSFSPLITSSESLYPTAYLAYMMARSPLDNVNDNAQYDLYVADMDGSNARRIFPPENQSGILSREYTWSADGRQLAVIYQDNLWLVDVASGTSKQVTLDNSVSHPVWKRSP
jgi:resuscitation-promoting factor RpfB